MQQDLILIDIGFMSIYLLVELHLIKLIYIYTYIGYKEFWCTARIELGRFNV